MYIPKAKSAQLTEETFVLLKPDCALSHNDILDRLYKEGFLIQCRKLHLSREQVMKVVLRYPKCGCKPISSAKPLWNFELPTFSEGALQQAAPTPLQPLRAMGETVMRRASHSRRSCDNTDALGLFSEVDKHVALLVAGGTALALVLSAPNAVERARVLVGPADPTEARAVAPQSLIALHGVDSVHNAAFAAQTRQDANDLIQLVFGYEPNAGAGSPKSASYSHAPTVKGDGSELLWLGMTSEGCTTTADPTSQLLLDLQEMQQTSQAPPRLALHTENLVRDIQQMRRRMIMEEQLLRDRELDLLVRERQLAEAQRASESYLSASPPRKDEDRRPSNCLPEDLSELIVDPSLMQKLFRSFRTHCNGTISAEEFSEFLATTPQLAECYGVPEKSGEKELPSPHKHRNVTLNHAIVARRSLPHWRDSVSPDSGYLNYDAFCVRMLQLLKQ